MKCRNTYYSPRILGIIKAIVFVVIWVVLLTSSKCAALDALNQGIGLNGPAFATYECASHTAGIISPNGKKVVFISSETGKPEIWLINIDGTERKMVSKLPYGQGATNPVWSPNSSLIAFTSHNLEGHSPLTTTHVWIVKLDGSEGRKLILPEPDARFSTFSPLWISDKVLQVRALVLQPDNNLVEKLYIYNHETGKFLECNLQQIERQERVWLLLRSA